MHKITFTSPANRYTDYTYDASGNLIRKRQYDNVSGSAVLQNTTDYVDGFVYTTVTGTQTLSYFAMPEGRVLFSGGAFTREFIITDQLGFYVTKTLSISVGAEDGVAVSLFQGYYIGSILTDPTSASKLLGGSADVNGAIGGEADAWISLGGPSLGIGPSWVGTNIGFGLEVGMSVGFGKTTPVYGNFNP